MNAYEVTITMSNATVENLAAANSALFVMKAVEYDHAGAPLLWARAVNIAPVTQCSWVASYAGWVAESMPLEPRGVVQPLFFSAMLPGDSLVVGEEGTGRIVAGGGPPGAFSFLNSTTTTPFLCGLAGAGGPSGHAPACALALDEEMLAVVTPLEDVLFCFSNEPYAAGSVITTAPAAAVLIEFSQMPGVSRASVAFDVASGWSWGDAAACAVPEGTDLTALLLR